MIGSRSEPSLKAWCTGILECLWVTRKLAALQFGVERWWRPCAGGEETPSSMEKLHSGCIIKVIEMWWFLSLWREFYQPFWRVKGLTGRDLVTGNENLLWVLQRVRTWIQAPNSISLNYNKNKHKHLLIKVLFAVYACLSYLLTEPPPKPT